MPTFRIKEAASLLGVSNDTLYRWIDAGRIAAADDASGVLAVDGVTLARLARELAQPTDHAEDKMVVAHSVRNRFAGWSAVWSATP
jgi:excisionase family DNA binding protein